MLFGRFTFTIFFPATSQREFSPAIAKSDLVAVVGVGVFGRNHARVYKELEQQGERVRLLGVVDPDLSRADAVASEFGCKGVRIGAPVVDHAQRGASGISGGADCASSGVAGELMKAGVDVLIEKPLAATLGRGGRTGGARGEAQTHRAGGTSGTVQSGGASDGSAADAAHVF